MKRKIDVQLKEKRSSEIGIVVARHGIAAAAIGWYEAKHCGGSSRLMDAESHEKMVMVGMHRGRSYIPARSIGSKQKRIGVSGTIVAAAVVRVRVGNGGP